MPGIGSRISGLHLRPQALSASIDLQGSRLWPDKNWTGEPGTGFLITPTDPTRTTAKPGVRLLTAPNQRFTNSHQVSVMAYANANGTLIGGIDRLRFHLEGNTLDVVEPTLRTFTRSDGSTYLAVPYSVNIARPSGGPVGDAHLYIEAIPADATMQSRVLGPYLYSFAATPYALQLEIAATPDEITGVRYKTLAAAINYLKSEAPDAARILATESASYTFTGENATNHTFKNWLTIEAAPGVEAVVVNEEKGDMPFRAGNVAFRNITFDMENISNIRSLTGTPFYADRCLFTSTDPDGVRAKWFGQPRPIGRVLAGSGYVTDCEFEYVNDPLSGEELARGNIMREGYADVAGDGRCMVGNIVREWDSSHWITGYEIFNVSYNGAEATARLSAPSSENEPRVLTAAWGSNSATLTLGKTTDDRLGITGNAYWPQDVVDWINGEGDYAGIGLKDQDAGWSATVLDNTSAAYFVNVPKDDPEHSGGAPGNRSAVDVNVKGVVRTLTASFDIHADGYQDRFGGLTENVIIANEDWELKGQLLFLSAFEDSLDYVVVNSVFKFFAVGGEEGVSASQLGRSPFSHVVLAHNTWVNQNLQIRADDNVTLDAYSLIANNVLTSINSVGTSIVPAGATKNNHLYGGNTIPTNSVGTSVGGDAATLFVDIDEYDYTPAGDLLLNGKAPVLAFDAKGRARKDIEVMGAVGSGSLSVTEYVPPSPRTDWDFSHFSPVALGTAQAEIVSATVGRAQRTDALNRAALSLPLLAGTYRLRGTNAAWGSFGNAQVRLGKGTIVSVSDVTLVGGQISFGAVTIDQTFILEDDATFLLYVTGNNRSFEMTKGADPLLVKTA